MDITEIIKNLFSGTNAETVLPIINLLRENAFDLKKVVQNLTPEKIIPVVQAFASAKSATEDTAAPFGAEKGGALTIANVADKEIVYCLNRYLNAEQSP